MIDISLRILKEVVMLFDKLFKKPEDPVPEKKPLLFTLQVELERYNSDVLDKGAQTFTLRDDGSAVSGRQIAGYLSPAVWNYIRSFGSADKLRRKGYNDFEVKVYGEADRSLIVPDPHKKPYQYDCKCGFPHMIPHEEYLCSLTDNGDSFDVYVDNTKVATYVDTKNRGKIDTIRRYLSRGWQTTAQLEPYHSKATLVINIRKV